MKFDRSELSRRGASTGSALILAIFTLALLSSMGLALLSLGEMEIRMSKGNLQVKKSFFLAEAGEEDGRLTLFAVNGKGSFDDDLGVVAGADGVIDFDPDNLALVYDGQGNVTGVTGFDDDYPLRPLQAFGEGWYAAFLTNDPLDGVASTTDNNDRVMITGVGAHEDRSVEIVQAIVEKKPILPPMPPSTVTLLGPTPTFVGGGSSSFAYLGDDCASGTPGHYAPVIGVIGDAAEATAEAGLDKDKGDQYVSGPYGFEQTFANLEDPTEPTVAGSGLGTIDPVWSDCATLQQVVAELRENATHSCCTPPVCDPPVPTDCDMPIPASHSDLIFVDGDLVLGGGVEGAGMLVVTGRLTIDGAADWNGLIVAVGKGEIERNGTGNGVLSGGIITADTAGPDSIPGNADDCTGGDGGLNPALFEVSGGGTGTVQYCTADIVLSTPIKPYEIVTFRQR